MVNFNDRDSLEANRTSLTEIIGVYRLVAARGQLVRKLLIGCPLLSCLLILILGTDVFFFLSDLFVQLSLFSVI